MLILHVNDAAGVAANLAKYQTRLGHTVSLVVRSKRKGKKNLLLRSIDVLNFYCYVCWVGRRFDVIHIHTQYLVCLFLPFKKKILEFHGSDVRRYPSRRWSIDAAVTGLFLKLYSGGLKR